MVNLERGEASRIGARLHPNSGRGHIKGDATWGMFVVDFKSFSKTFGLSQDVWAKICTDTMRVDRNKSPMLLLTLGTGTNKTRLAVIELGVLEELVERQAYGGNID